MHLCKNSPHLLESKNVFISELLYSAGKTNLDGKSAITFYIIHFKNNTDFKSNSFIRLWNSDKSKGR